ncbi:MAG: fibronectin type III domain-containing protein, partial [Actinobacteria bacterium]|nr:fibronectin type III domain-containing protein [Actinomycetota bacterium]
MKLRKSLAAFIVVALVLATVPPMAFGWSAPLNVSGTSNNSTKPAVAVDASGNIYIAWQEDVSGTGLTNNINFRAYKKGSGWTQTVNLTSSLAGNSTGPKLAVDGSGKLHAIWSNFYSDGTNQYLRAYHNSYTDAAGWESTPTVVSTGLQAYNPAIAARGNTVVVVWSNGGQVLNYKVYDGAAWSGERAITLPTLDSLQVDNPAIAIDAGGVVHAAWQGTYRPDPGGSPGGYSTDIFASDSSNGINWTTPFDVSNRSTPRTIGVNSRYPVLAVGSSGPVYLLWQESGALKSSLENAGSWGAVGPGPAVTNGAIDYKPVATMAVASPSMAYAVLEADDGIRYSTNNGGAGWSATSLIGGSTGAVEPAAAVDSDGNVHVAWVSGTGNLEIFYANLLDADMLTPTAPSNLTVASSGSNLNLSWTASTDNVGVAGYKIERSPDQATWTQIGVVIGNPPPTSFSDAPPANTTQYYRVRAYDAAGNNSGYSNVASGYVDTLPPTAPSNLTVAQSGGNLNLTWTASVD